MRLTATTTPTPTENTRDEQATLPSTPIAGARMYMYKGFRGLYP